MLKFIAIFFATLFLAVNCESLLGGYTDHPELVEDSIMKGLVQHVSKHLANAENLLLDNIKITRVQTQVVSGINYKFDFTGETGKGDNGKSVKCHAALYVRFDLSVTINKAHCETI